MRTRAVVCLVALFMAFLAAPSLWAQTRSESELRVEIEEEAINPCLRTVLGNVGLLGKVSVAQYRRYLSSIGNKADDLMIEGLLPLVSDLAKPGDRMEIYHRARFDCIKGAMNAFHKGGGTTAREQRILISKIRSAPKPIKRSWIPRFEQVAPVTRKLIKRSDDTILEVSVGGGSGMWHLIVEVARNTATAYARTVGENALYIMERKFSEFGPADFDVVVQRAGTPWDSKTYVSTIWKGIKRKGERRIQWEQVIGKDSTLKVR